MNRRQRCIARGTKFGAWICAFALASCARDFHRAVAVGLLTPASPVVGERSGMPVMKTVRVADAQATARSLPVDQGVSTVQIDEAIFGRFAGDRFPDDDASCGSVAITAQRERILADVIVMNALLADERIAASLDRALLVRAQQVVERIQNEVLGER